RGLENSGRTIRLPVHVAQRSRKVGRVERGLSVRLGREPTIEELAAETGLPIEQVEEVRHQRAALVSLDQQIGEDGDTALGDLLPSDAEAPEETAWENERERIVHRAISQLPETERTVLTLRFGTGREEPQTLTAIGKRLGFSAERASQLEQRALKKLAESPELAALREAAQDSSTTWVRRAQAPPGPDRACTVRSGPHMCGPFFIDGLMALADRAARIRVNVTGG